MMSKQKKCSDYGPAIYHSKARKERPSFTAEERMLLWKSYQEGNRDAAIPLIMIYTGMTAGEMLNLKTSMINLEAKTITGVGLKAKARREGTICLVPGIVPVIKELIAGKAGTVFPVESRAFNKRYYTALEDACVRKFSPSTCRYTTPTALLTDCNIAPQAIRQIMRCSMPTMQDRYVHPGIQDVRNTAELTEDSETDEKTVKIKEDSPMEREIPICEKYVLSTVEASDYFHIGINRLRKMIREEPEAEWILWTGSHACIKRKMFEKKIDSMSVV